MYIQHLNTSYVKVQFFKLMLFYVRRQNLNTSYVKVQYIQKSQLLTVITYLNTSYVKVQYGDVKKRRFVYLFKYILC